MELYIGIVALSIMILWVQLGIQRQLIKLLDIMALLHTAMDLMNQEIMSANMRAAMALKERIDE